jgi:hypothetical protein
MRTGSPKIASEPRGMTREIASENFNEAVGIEFCHSFLFFTDKNELERLLELL